MVDPKLFEFVGYDPERYSGFAFGLGLERIAMLRHEFPDLRELWRNDLRFARQFYEGAALLAPRVRRDVRDARRRSRVGSRSRRSRSSGSLEVGVADEGGNLGHFVVGRVVSAEPHPNADRLQLCQVDVGNPDPQQIVCGAWNFGAGATVAVGLPGALLPGVPGPARRSDRCAARSRAG